MHDRLENFSGGVFVFESTRRRSRDSPEPRHFRLGTVVVLVTFALLGKIPLTIGVVGHEGSTRRRCHEQPAPPVRRRKPVRLLLIVLSLSETVPAKIWSPGFSLGFKPGLHTPETFDFKTGGIRHSPFVIWVFWNFCGVWRLDDGISLVASIFPSPSTTYTTIA